MPHNPLIDLFHVKHTNRPGFPGRIRFDAWGLDASRYLQLPACM